MREYSSFDADSSDEKDRRKSSFNGAYTRGISVALGTGPLKDRDLTQWLENKLGSTDELWNSRAAAGLLTREILENLDSCFLDLQTHVKLRLLLGILHLSKRNLEQVFSIKLLIFRLNKYL